MSEGTFDDTGSSQVTGSSITIPVRGIKGVTSYEFTNGTYSVSFTVTNAENSSFNRTYYSIPVTFNGTAGTVTLAGYDDSSPGGGADDGMGTITISNLPERFTNGKIAHTSVTGTHDSLSDYILVGGQMLNSTFDDTGSSQVTGTSITIPVRGIKGGTSYEFTNGTYRINFTVTYADKDDAIGVQGLPVMFNGTAGTFSWPDEDW